MNIEFLNSCIANFISFLNANYQLVTQSYEMHKFHAEQEKLLLVSFEEYFDDWAQANWELLVERVVCSTNESFVIYGSGSDYEAAAHSRVFFHNVKPTHKIVCFAKSTVMDRLSKTEVDLTKFDFDAFVTSDGKWFNVSPPFDHVLLTEKAVVGNYQQIVIPIEQINFGVQKIGI
ncbi:MAG: hypothetical protein KKF22_13175 [Gammaproteobacteria bacterium]|nr:hypothetical protein [Gammaproteobacteria bacterium]